MDSLGLDPLAGCWDSQVEDSMCRVRDVRVAHYLWRGNISDYIFIMSHRFGSQTQNFSKLWVYFEDTNTTPNFSSSYQGVEVFVIWWYHMLGVLAVNGYSISVDI